MVAVAYNRPDTPVGYQAPTGSSLLNWRDRLDNDATRERSRILLCAGMGILMNALVFAAALLAARVATRLHPDVSAANPNPHQFACVVASLICGMMLLIAAVTKPDGRAELANQVLNNGLNSPAARGHGAEAVAVMVLMLLALYGSFAIVEAFKRAVMQCRLAAVDRYETARVMAAISGAPLGLRWTSLLKYGQSERSLRGPIAALLLNGWIKIADDGQTLVQQSPAMRTLLLRHPLADVFHAGE